MTTQNTAARGDASLAVADSQAVPLSGIITRIIGLALVDAFAIWFLYRLLSDGAWFLGAVILIVTLAINLFYLREDLYEYRWFAPGLALMGIIVIYPTLFTMYVAFTNYKDGNILTKQQALRVLLDRTYAAADGPTFNWTPYQNEAGEFILWLEDDSGAYIARPDEPFVPASELGFDEPPDEFDGYTKLSLFQAAADPNLSSIQFGSGTEAVRISGTSALQLSEKYDYDESTDTLTDLETGTTYTPDRGTFTSANGEVVRPGYYVPIGLANFQRMFSSSLLGGEMLIVFIWTFVHAFLAVFVTFWLGLLLAIVLDNELVPAKKILRSLILIPYTIPAFISVLVWRGLLDPNLGVINEYLEALTFGAVSGIDWKGSVFWARSAIILIQLWLGFPYMLLICTGALQGIPTEMYEAADVDGAGPLTKFWQLTLPLLLVAVGPLLIASFAFNFNNFTVIQLYNDGRPTIGTTSVAGYTDILITYTYSIAFDSGARDYGFATAITIVIFVLLTGVTLFNFRLTRRLEEISENV